MSVQKSPAGSIFPYYFKGGELFGMHLESFNRDEEGVITIMKAEEEFLLKQHRTISLWINFYGTSLTPVMISEFVIMLVHLRPMLTKLGIVGCSWITRWKISRQIKKMELLSNLPVKYSRDPEDIKTWLVSETHS